MGSIVGRAPDPVGDLAGLSAAVAQLPDTERVLDRVMSNLRGLAGRNVQVRVPLIPGVTDTEVNLRGIFALVRDIGFGSVALLPFNPSSGAKYEWLGLDYETDNAQGPQDLTGYIELARQEGPLPIIG
jgi:pyruvate-formate lyase-activating enzyme